VGDTWAPYAGTTEQPLSVPTLAPLVANVTRLFANTIEAFANTSEAFANTSEAFAGMSEAFANANNDDHESDALRCPICAAPPPPPPGEIPSANDTVGDMPAQWKRGGFITCCNWCEMWVYICCYCRSLLYGTALTRSTLYSYPTLGIVYSVRTVRGFCAASTTGTLYTTEFCRE
jgi:hypothetical protein